LITTRFKPRIFVSIFIITFPFFHPFISEIVLPKEHHEGLADMPEVVVPLDGRVGVERDVAKHLHADDRVDEEQHHH
jgi:hypothetical protein